MHKLDVQQHSICMLKLAIIYKEETNKSTNSIEIKNKMSNAYIRAMQAFCRDLCLYCKDIFEVKKILQRLKKNKLYPFGVDWKNFRIDKKQSRKNDLLNWLFGLLSFEPYFWFCWIFCFIFRLHRLGNNISVRIYDEILDKS